MKSAIEKIYYGKANSQNIPVTEEWKRLAAKCLKIYEEFYPSLNEKQKQQYEEMAEYESSQEAEVVRQSYKEGFKLGLALAAESIID